MANPSEIFELTLKSTPCIECLSEDDIRQIVNSLKIEVKSDNFKGFVTVGSPKGVTGKVHVGFGADGNFTGIYAKIDGKVVTLVHGVGENVSPRLLFPGAPTATNPGPGWQVDSERSQRILNQTGAESGWTEFYAYKVSVVNSF